MLQGHSIPCLPCCNIYNLKSGTCSTQLLCNLQFFCGLHFLPIFDFFLSYFYSFPYFSYISRLHSFFFCAVALLTDEGPKSNPWERQDWAQPLEKARVSGRRHRRSTSDSGVLCFVLKCLSIIHVIVFILCSVV
jgi:hypothetical protein